MGTAGQRGARPATNAGEGLWVDHQLESALGSIVAVPAGAPPIAPAQVQAASLDLRLGREAHRIRAGFLPGRATIEERLAELAGSRVSLEGAGAVLERGLVYLVQLEERFDLPPNVRASFNPRSSTGRCDVFTRVLIPGHSRFNEAPPGWSGRPWIEIVPLSFPVRLARGDRLAQVRLEQGRAALTTEELRREYAATPLCHGPDGPIPLSEVRFDEDGGIELHLGLAGRDPAGWRAQQHTGVVSFSEEGAHDPAQFWEPVHARAGSAILAPGGFYLFASRERVLVPPHLAAEMLPVDVRIGELRNNYAGFFDNGFGWPTLEDSEGTAPGAAPLPGTPAVLEVRAHDVPFLVEDGQVFFRLRWFRSRATPRRLYAQGRRGRSYRGQDLTLARCFRAPAGD